MKKTAPAQTEKPKEEKLELPSLKRVEHKVVEKAEEHREEPHLKHVVKHVEEEVRSEINPLHAWGRFHEG